MGKPREVASIALQTLDPWSVLLEKIGEGDLPLWGSVLNGSVVETRTPDDLPGSLKSLTNLSNCSRGCCHSCHSFSLALTPCGWHWDQGVRFITTGRLQKVDGDHY